MNIVPLGKDANYRVTVRQFDEMIEITSRVINHQWETARSENCGLVAPRRKERNTDMTDEDRQRKDDENKLRSVRRARQGVRWMVQRLQADHMLTLTYRENMQDIDRLKIDFDHFRRLVQARYPDWKYVAIREKQERGAYHLHIALKGFQNINFLRTCWHTVLGCLGKTGQHALGNIDVTRPKGQSKSTYYQWRQDRLAAYMTKYLHKEFDTLEHHSKRYWASRGAPKPSIKRYWLGSQNIIEMIKDVLDIAMVHGLDDGKSYYQNKDQTLLFLSGRYNPRCTISHNGDLWLED